MSEQTIVKTTYRSGGAGDLLDYIGREGHSLRDHTGERITESQRERFIEKSESHNFERDLIISPANGEDLSDREFHRGTRRTMNEFVKDRPTTSYVYAVHDDTEHKHAHVALTGEKRELYLDRDDLAETREIAHERFQSRTWEREQEQERERTREVEPEIESELEFSEGKQLDPEINSAEDRQAEREREREERERDLDRDTDRGMGWGR